MPKVSLKPITKMTKAQWKALLARIFEKEGKLARKAIVGKTPRGFQRHMMVPREVEMMKGMTGTPAGIMEMEPPVEREMGSLFKDIEIGPGETQRIAERLPIAEARAKYFANPQEYVTPTTVEPSIKELAMRQPGPGQAPSELAKTVAYERLRFRPIIPPGTQRAAKVLRKEEQLEDVTRKLRGMGIREEDIRPGVKPAQVLAEKGMKGETPPIEEVIQTARIADALWKQLGGGRSWKGQYWNTLREAQPGAIQRNFPSGRDYFISCFNAWKRDPKKFAIKHPRETKLLEEIWEAFIAE